jgi:hypothetical protein
MSAATAELEDLDMMDSEIVELGAEAAQAAPAGEIQEASLDLEASIVEETGAEMLEAELGAPLEESVPESAPRAAAAAPAAATDFEMEPLKTPPPESGRQIVAPVQAPAVAYQDEAEEADLSGGGDVDSLLEPDLSGGPISKAPPGMPTMEQLGETVELEGADGPAAALELEALPVPAIEEAPLDEMELDLPKQEFSGAYDSSLAAPANAAADLARHRQEQADAAKTGTPVSISAPPSPSAPTAEAAARAVPAPIAAPIVVARPPLDVMHTAEVVAATPAKAPETFLELLDQSLSLKI